MTHATDAHAPWTEILDELRRLRKDRDRGEDALWDAIEELRSLVLGVDPEASSEASDDGMDAFTYRRVKHRFRRMVERNVPPGARVAVVSRGDGDLLVLDGMEGEHFPQDVTGCYAGFYPSDGTGTIAHLEWLRAKGTEWLAFPASAGWWLDEFPKLCAHLEATCVERIEDESGGWLFSLGDPAKTVRPAVERVRALVHAWSGQGRAPSVLEWDSGLDLERRLAGATVFSPPENGSRLPYLDGSVDVVVVGDAGRLGEARRVARRSVIMADTSWGAQELVIEHVDGGPPALRSASIVVPTYNGIRNVDTCLRGLIRTLPEGFEGEVIVVDDGSGSETREGLRAHAERHPWLRVVRNEENLGFIGSCNRGAEEARGEYIVFLNDDTVPMGDWLGALLSTFERFPDAGAAGGRLVYPDGRLQEAGGVVFRDGSGANVGRDAWDVDAHRFDWVRPVDYCSGALLATPTELFHELGGFDRRYLPAYYEDTDYCFRVREAGRRVYYQPRATVVHTEGATSGVDPSAGVKRHQIRNQDVFSRRWKRELACRPQPPGAYTEAVWEQLTLSAFAHLEVAS